MSVQNFLDRIEATGLVNPALMAELRKRVAESKRRLRPEMIAKLLVDRGELTAAQARKLVMDEANQPDPEEDIFTGEPVETLNDELTLANDDLQFANDDLLTSDSDLNFADDDADIDAIPDAILLDDDEEDITEAVAEEIGDSLAPVGLEELLDEPHSNLDDEGRVIRRPGSFFTQLFGEPKKSGARQNRWDSPLILIGGGALILMSVAGLGMFLLLHNESVDEIYAAGDEAYKTQAYGVAIEKFERLTTKYPDNENASIARVRTELSRLRQHTDSSRPDWPAALSQAKQSLPTVSAESALAEVRAELAKLLPDISNGLVERSSAAEVVAEKKQLLALAEDSLELVHNPLYLPTTVKQTQELRIEGIEANMDVVRRDILREEALAATAEQIGAAAADGRIVEAYSLRDDLVAKYPILIGNATLNDALSNVADKERAAVSVAESNLKPEQADHPPVSRVQLVLSDRRGDKATGVDNQVYSVLARGAVYALSASDGRVLWRRFVGYETEVFPQNISDEVTSDLLIVDGRHSELQRVSASNGKLKWRLPCPAPLSTPRIVGNRAYVCSGLEDESRLLAVDLDSGRVIKEANFPVGCDTPPGVLYDGKQLAVAGVHSSVYIVDASTMECKSVIPIGHARGSIVTSPVWLGDMLIVSENTGAHSARIQRYKSIDDVKWTPVAAPIPVTGQIISSPLVNSRRLLVHTEQGEVRIFEVPIDSDELREIAMIESGGQSVGRSHAEFLGSQIWIADQKLTRFQLQPTRGELLTEWIRDRRDHFLNPIVRTGDQILSVRKRSGMLGVTVAAHSSTDNKGEPIWETDIAVPSEALVSSKDAVFAVTSNGAMFPIDADAVKAGVTDRRQARVDTRLMPSAFAQSLPVATDQVVFAGPPPTTHMVVADLAAATLNRTPLRIDTDIANQELVAFQGAILAACETGPIHCLDVRSGKQLTSPFVPRIQPGQNVDWMRPAALSKSRFMAAEKDGQLYLVTLQGKKLSVTKQAEVAGPLVAGLAAIGQTGFAVSSIGGTDEVIAINTNLVVTNTTPLKSGVAWGPKRIGDQVLVSDGSHTLSAFDAAGKSKWSANLDGPLAGSPLLQGPTLVVATTAGMISVLDTNSGNIVAKQDLGEPLGGGAVAYKGRLLVVGWDGTLYLVDVPK